MPYLKHILEPQLRQAVDRLQAQLPASPAVQQQASRSPGGPLPGELAKQQPLPDRGPLTLKEMVDMTEGTPAPQPAPSPEPAAPMGRSYLQSVANPAPQIESFDPRLQTPLGQYAMSVGSLPSTQGFLQFKNSAMGMKPVPQVNAVPEPAPDMPATSVPTRNKKGKVVIAAAPGEPVGVAEDGQAIDISGKKLGFLQQQGDTRFADRRIGDVGLTGPKDGVQPSFGQDGDAQGMIQGAYGPYLKEYRDNGNRYFTEMFNKPQTADEIRRGVKPERMSPAQVDNIKKGLKVLLDLERGTKT